MILLRDVVHASEGHFFDEGLYVWTELTRRRRSESNKGIRSGERPSALGFPPLNCVDEVLSSLPRRTLEVPADRRVDDGEIKK